MITLNRQSSERIVAGGESSVGEDGGVDPGQEIGDAGVHVRNVRDILWYKLSFSGNKEVIPSHRP